MRISQCRTACGLTQRELGSKMGVSQNTVSDWEHEVILPRTRQIPDLARVLGVDIGELFAAEPGEQALP